MPNNKVYVISYVDIAVEAGLKNGKMEKHIQIRSESKNLRVVENLIDTFSGEYSFDSEVYGKILIASVEAVNNAIIHGNKSDPEKYVNVKFTMEDEQLHVIVEDEGEGFDYENVPDPTSPENIENIHGRGVFLMIQLSDEVHFYDNGSRIELIFYLKKN